GSEAARRTGLHVGDMLYLAHGWGGASQEGTLHTERPDEHVHDGHEHGDHDHDDDDRDHEDGGAPHAHRGVPWTVGGGPKPTFSSHDRAVYVSIETAWILHAHDRRHRADPSMTTTSRTDLTDEDRKVTGVYVRTPTRAGTNSSAAIATLFDALRRQSD